MLSSQITTLTPKTINKTKQKQKVSNNTHATFCIHLLLLYLSGFELVHSVLYVTESVSTLIGL